MNRDNNFGKYRLLVFDWDGTLIDSIDGIINSLQIASTSAGAQAVSDHRARSVIGLGLREAIEALHPDLESLYVDRITDAYRQHYLYENTIESKLFTGVRDMLEQLRDSGYLLAVATGKSRIGLDRVLDEHDMAGLFDITRCAGECHSKPHPQMLLEILDQLDMAAGQALMIGDSVHDLMMAHNAHVDAIAVCHGVNTAEELIPFNPVLCLDDITDLTGFLSHNKNHGQSSDQSGNTPIPRNQTNIKETDTS